MRNLLAACLLAPALVLAQVPAPPRPAPVPGTPGAAGRAPARPTVLPNAPVPVPPGPAAPSAATRRSSSPLRVTACSRARSA